ncbi:MAG: hypothetical protein Q8P26_01070 [Candidatus Levybacteria bacterium]|nr:hypothetical protein [Candidatus Levybacteria bacterium]
MVNTVELSRRSDARLPLSDATSNPMSLGDLEKLHPDIRAHVVTTALKRITSENPLSHEAFLQEAKMLREQLKNFSLFVNSPENYPPQATEKIVSRYKKADLDSKDENNPIVKAALRLSQFTEPTTYIADYDGTVSDPQKPFTKSGTVDVDPENYLTALIPGSSFAEQLLESHGREMFPEVFAATWQHVLKSPQGSRLLEEAGSHIPLRDGLESFFSFVENSFSEFKILSANFEPIIIGGLRKTRANIDIHVHGIQQNNILSTDKGNALIHFAQQDPNKPIVYIGDGASDLPSIQAKDFAAFYFALEGGKFAEALRRQRVPHFTYNNFFNIIHTLQRIENIKKEKLAS